MKNLTLTLEYVTAVSEVTAAFVLAPVAYAIHKCRALVLLALVMTTACMTTTPPTDVDTPCGVDDDLLLAEDGSIVHGITQCSVCARVEASYHARAAELGCDAPYPLDGCPIDAGLTDCSVRQTGIIADFVRVAADCDELSGRAGTIESYGGIECGDTCTWSDPYSVPVTSTVEQPPPRNIHGGWDRDRCPEGGRAYHERGEWF